LPQAVARKQTFDSTRIRSNKEFPVVPPEDAVPAGPTPQELKSAMKAFKKRLKLTRLDDQSRLGVGPMSSGRESAIVGIMPPEQFPQAVWEELVRLGRLKRVGHMQYAMVEPR
jgi:hypothetical protein